MRQASETGARQAHRRCVEPAFWYFDRRRARMALEAAIHNARRFARRDIGLMAVVEVGRPIFRVDDDGPGLGAQDPSELSTGLGTQLCQAVAQAHRNLGWQGRVTLANGPAGGARFELRLP